MKETFTKYLQKHFPLDGVLGESAKTDGTQAFNKFKLPAGKKFLLTLLMLSPYICGAGFLATFGIKVAISFDLIAARHQGQHLESAFLV